MRHDVTRGWGQHAAGVNGAQTFANAMKVVTPAIREVADHGASRGVKTSLENHGFYMQESPRVEKLLKAYLAHRASPDETFLSFARRHDGEALRQLAEAQASSEVSA